MCLYYRTDLLDAAGLKGPPFSMEDVLKDAKALNNPEKGVYGFVMSAKRDRICYDFSQYLWTFGGDFFDAKLSLSLTAMQAYRPWNIICSSGRSRCQGLADITLPKLGPPTWRDMPLRMDLARSGIGGR